MTSEERLERIERRLDVLTQGLGLVVEFMADIDKARRMEGATPEDHRDGAKAAELARLGLEAIYRAVDENAAASRTRKFPASLDRLRE